MNPHDMVNLTRSCTYSLESKSSFFLQLLIR